MENKRGGSYRIAIIVAVIGAAATIIGAIITGILSDHGQPGSTERIVIQERDDASPRKNISMLAL